MHSLEQLHLVLWGLWGAFHRLHNLLQSEIPLVPCLVVTRSNGKNFIKNPNCLGVFSEMYEGNSLVVPCLCKFGVDIRSLSERITGVLISAHFEKDDPLVIPRIRVIGIDFNFLVHEFECLFVLPGLGEFVRLI